MILFIILVIILYWVIIFFTYLFAKRLRTAPILVFTGSLGQGKSLIGVSKVIKTLKIKRLLWLLGIIKSKNYDDIEEVYNAYLKDEGLEQNYKKRDNKTFIIRESIPLLYSNIPIVFKNGLLLRLLAKIKKLHLLKYENSITLEYEHLVMIKPIREYSSIFMDEIGEIADQYSYDNPFIIQYLQVFIRFFRHFIDGTIVLTDQATDNITKPIRVRIGKVYLLDEFRRFMLHFFKVNVLDVKLTEDVQTINSIQLDEPPYFFGYLPYKYFKAIDWTRVFTYKKYESRCYKPLYDFAVINEEEIFENGEGGLFTRYVISMPNNSLMKKQFRQQGFIDKQSMLQYIEEWRKNVFGNEVDESESGKI